ncbi:putative GGDEF family protein [Vibrio orientalis CIP 102891 = ATCC 33934]|uniref:diguanylate cyclase n=1 Tax=Vibrio orientalis CIP 102891 = ATCC 33934 TaxID=675816 RepID=C9QHX0_VIBOR|nr:tetratricopeptide repeat-containing diguanylate cyclase [Vibrio orientalis]EEX92291.1 putative GGDEF family protein [Vibrio orientalis CIP 102891 = ATCC 33934]EGU53196.1 putative GGDEF family protein [Vibrio orientalis CIP 102891 = ATCC 33934]
MKHQLVSYLFILATALLISPTSIASSDWQEWELAYHEVSANSDSRGLSMLEDRYNALPPGLEKLYISSKIHGFMMLRGQPYHGNQLAFNRDHTEREQLFIAALNAEEQLNFTLSLNNYTQLLSYANKTNDIQGKILFEYHLCRSLNKQGLYHNANIYCSSLQTHLDDVPYSLLPKYQALRVIANNFESIGDYQTALKSYQEYLTILPSNVDPSGVYNDSGLLLMTLGQIEQAVEYLNIALKIRHENNSQLELAQSHHSMGKILLAAQNYDSAVHHFTQAKTILTQYQHSYGLTYALLGLGQASHFQGHYSQSYKLLLEALELASIQGNDQLRGEIYLTLSSSLQDQGKYISADNFAQKAHLLGQKIGSVGLNTSSLKALASIAESQQNYEQALAFYKEYTLSELSKRTLQHQSAYIALDSTQKEYQQQANHLKSIEENNDLLAKIDKLNSLNTIYLIVIALLCCAMTVYAWKIKQRARKAEMDYLTGALNRAAAIREIKSVAKLTSQEQKHLLILLDLDDFKSINDRYGHPTGDTALTHVAHIINNHLNEEDIFGRLGGEEFVVVVKCIDELDVLEKVESLHQAIAHTIFEAENKEKVNVTATLSFLTTSKSLGDFDELYSILDQALYQAKQSGKNCIIDALNEPIYLPASACAPIQP